ncbi:MAG: hypothetical protein USCAAHI_02550 [Beijerinckiaceae bacterium]|jgi:hypothetical protein|nr:MAG: hypothetical protein USCAAHI_02550 [Beijerinckiaceae bacterium]
MIGAFFVCAAGTNFRDCRQGKTGAERGRPS